MAEVNRTESSFISITTERGSVITTSGANIPTLDVLVGAYRQTRKLLSEIRDLAADSRNPSIINRAGLLQSLIGHDILGPLITAMDGPERLETIRQEFQHSPEPHGRMLLPSAAVAARIHRV